MRLLSVEELLTSPDPLAGDPIVVVDGRIAEADADRIGHLPAVLVGIDIDPGDGADLDRIEAIVRDHADAAVALAVLLRGGPRRTVADGLAAESAVYSMLQAGDDHGRWLASRTPARPAGGDDRPPVAIERDGDRLTITLDRPDVHNAYSAAMRDGLIEALAVAAADPEVRVELRGAGRSFSAGGDLAEFGSSTNPAAAHRVRLRASAAAAMAAVADRTTVHLHGVCVGAGIELPAFAGHVVAATDTRIWLPEVAMGLIPGAGGTVSIPRRIGAARTLRLGLTGEALDAATALDWGLVDLVE